MLISPRYGMFRPREPEAHDLGRKYYEGMRHLEEKDVPGGRLVRADNILFVYLAGVEDAFEFEVVLWT